MSPGPKVVVGRTAGVESKGGGARVLLPFCIPVSVPDRSDWKGRRKVTGSVKSSKVSTVWHNLFSFARF